MASIFNRNNPNVAYYSPPRKLKNSIASSATDGRGGDFPAESAGIPDKFATTESPKLKFLFAVQFFPRNEDFNMADNGSVNMDDLIFALKRASRPNIAGTYQPINMYNYRTQVLTKIEYGTTPATLVFYDDASNRALNIVVDYLTAISPISGKNIEDAATLGDSNSSSVGAIVNAFGPLAAIRVAHHSINPSDQNSIQSVYYDYINPKIISITLDDLDMTVSDVTNVEFSFTYDSVRIITPSTNSSSNNSNINPSVTVGNTDDVNNVGIS